MRSNGRVMRPVRVLDRETSKCQLVPRDLFTLQKPGKSVQGQMQSKECSVSILVTDQGFNLFIVFFFCVSK